MADRSESSRRRGAASLACVVAAVLLSGPAFAQGGYSRPVVQPTPSPSLNDLNAAMRDLARNKNDVAALLRAGWASLDLGDTQAALGFFTRAQTLQPQNGEVKAGLASTALHNGSPVVAVRLFAEAEASGTPMARYAADRGLAMDLVGDNVSAQRFYRQALAYKDDPEVDRRLALSQAIAGDLAGSEATLLPLLQHRDLAAYRTRAFALAIAGKGEDAVSIAETMLPAQISNRMAPYLRYMPRLTRAQQAAAANLGQFPPAADIGRDDAAIAALSKAATPQVASAAADSRLVPTGTPLGQSAQPAAARGRPQARTSKPKPAKGGTVNVTYTPLAAPRPQAAEPAKIAAAVPPPAVAPRPAELAPPRVAAAVQPPPPEREIPEAAKPVLVASLDSAPPPEPVTEAPRPSFSISPPVSAGEPPPKPESLSEAFAAFAKPPPVARPEAAVDILKLKPTREPSKADEAKAKADEAKAKAAEAKAKADAKAKAEAKAKAKANPQRFWAQVGTGRNLKALAFSWRRLQDDAGAVLAKRDPYTAKWGATRRLLAGPFKTEEAADKAVAALKKKGIDAFEFTSDEGEEVAPIE